MTHDDVDVVVIGGGIAGSASASNLAAHGLSVLMLEKQKTYTDLVRGEWLAPWGIRETQLLGVDDAFAAGGAWEIREWVQWDEVVHPDDAMAVDMTRFLPEVGGPQSFPHWGVCEAVTEQAVRLGAQVVMGASKIEVTAGREPSVRYRTSEGEHEVRARMVLGASGRACAVGRQIGVSTTTEVHHWGAGMLVEGLDDWPVDVQAMGTEGDVMFMVFPQGYGRARLYLNFATGDQEKYRGADRVERFLAAYDLAALPDGGKAVQAAKQAGPLVVWPSVVSITDQKPLAEGVVLIGDEAGTSDTILGTGLSTSLRDARMVCEVLTGGDDWSQEAFEPFISERNARMERLHYGAKIMTKLQVEFGPHAVERRRRARRLMTENDAFQVTGLLNMVGPENVPEFGFSEFFAERLLRETV
ncbi:MULTISPECIES: NAD(P)/FAD-dependent oxidoreductase [Actinoalloteichus]|uniref:Flavin-dependent dehydrogenase n=1 Tax=Actinoalloteichus fjordicus TaxID=1612552 RepID=A0AAC9LA93_9PSEU|nr:MULTISPECIES: NAD(P)/FAD-dependent oxidoreductase [Actinoalloteichus]APU13224.1 flavin-dependent dehydrogenase [Actinoalloteichus fjordicus]APU19175.1 flavin-dependent dehydrogenase [Actinoalloteichus sp. GBA129-24]